MIETISVPASSTSRKMIVTLAAAARVVVLLKVRTRERRGADAVELRLAVLLQRLAHHLGR